MSWRIGQAESRERYRNTYDAAEAARYDATVGTLGREDEDAYLADLDAVFSWRPGLRVLDAGAGTGTLCKLLSRVEGLLITALEPAPGMLAQLSSKPELSAVHAVEGFCDAPEDRDLFDAGQFDVVASRQLANGLFDPLAAFRNWHHWLAPAGSVVLIDGFYGRSAWTGPWEEEVDVLPLSACKTLALNPYLLESAGFTIDAVELMTAANERPTTVTTRYVVVARRA